MEFKVGDKVRAKSDCTNDIQGGEGTIAYVSSDDSMIIHMTKSGKHYSEGRDTCCANWAPYIELISSDNSNFAENTMEKKVFSVLVMDKKTGKVIKKDDAVLATTEQDALLKAFGVDAEDSFIKIQEVGKFEVKEPVQAVLVKETKA